MQPRYFELQFADPPSDAFLLDFDKEVRQFVDFLDCGLDDIPIENFEDRIFILFESHEFSESFDGNERRFALISGNIEVVETDFPQDEGVSAGEPVLQAEVEFRVNTRVVEFQSQMRCKTIRADAVFLSLRMPEVRQRPIFPFCPCLKHST